MNDITGLPKSSCRDFLHEKLEMALHICEQRGCTAHDLATIVADVARTAPSWELISQCERDCMQRLMSWVEGVRQGTTYEAAFAGLTQEQLKDLRQQMIQTFWSTINDIEQRCGGCGQD